MAFEYIKEADISQGWKDAKKYMEPLHEPFDEYERIADNKPWPGIAKNMPKVTDGTTAGIIQDQPKRVVQQIPTGLVKGNDKAFNIIAEYILINEILAHSNMQASLLQKTWAGGKKALTYGSQAALVQFVQKGDRFTCDFSLPYMRDVFLEPGKLSDRDSNVIYLRTYYTPSQIDAIISKESMLTKNSKDRKDEQEYKSGWDITVLESLKDELSEKDASAQNQTERRKANQPGYIELIHVFQRGIGATFYTYSPKAEKIVRRRVNKDPRGAIPVHLVYAEVTLSNPLGRGVVEMSGPLQNLLDSEMQSYQYMRALMLNPPLDQKGNYDKKPVYAPGALWKSSDPQASITPAKLETASLQQFPQNYGLIKSQILNLNSTSDSSISAEAGNPSFSKTDAGVKANDARLGVSDNVMRKNMEDWLAEIMETMLNLYFAERSGVQELEVDEETAAKLRKIDPAIVNEANMVRIDYDEEVKKLKFEVDAGSSKEDDSAEQTQAAVQLLELTAKYPQLDSKQGGPIDIDELAGRIVASSALTDQEKIIVTPEDKGSSAQQQSVTPEMVQQMIMQAMQQMQESMKTQPKPLSESLNIKFSDLPEDAKRKLLHDELGIDSADPMPTTLDHSIKASDAALKVAQFQHTASQPVANPDDPQSTPEDTSAANVGSASNQSPFGPDEQQLIDKMQKAGYSEDAIGQAIASIHAGVPNDQIMTGLHG